MRTRNPRRALGRRREARARVHIIEGPRSESGADGNIRSEQKAEVTLPRAELEGLWTPEYLERLARTYWRFLTRVSLGLLRVRYTADSREIAFLARPFVLLRFYAPEYVMEPDRGTVTWSIRSGLLVAPAGRGKGYLRISVRRPARDEGGELVTGTVTSEVAQFYPLIAGWGWFSRIGRRIYEATQLRIHVVVTHAFLRSLARLDLEHSVVGALLPPSRQAVREREAAQGR